MYRELAEEDVYDRNDILDLDTFNEKLKTEEEEVRT